MQVNILNFETSMQSNSFDENTIQKQADRQFGKVAGDNGVLQVAFHKIKNSGLCDVTMRLDTDKKSYSSSASSSTASKSFADAVSKMDAQINKQRDLKKSRTKQPRGSKAVAKTIGLDEASPLTK